MSSLCTRSFASAEMEGQGALVVSSAHACGVCAVRRGSLWAATAYHFRVRRRRSTGEARAIIRFTVSASLFPEKGARPHSITYKSTPSDLSGSSSGVGTTRHCSAEGTRPHSARRPARNALLAARTTCRTRRRSSS